MTDRADLGFSSSSERIVVAVFFLSSHHGSPEIT